MFNDIWKEAIIKATPIMLLVISLTTIAVMPAYVMTGILVNQQNIQTKSN